jgi:hypothetical protein
MPLMVHWTSMDMSGTGSFSGPSGTQAKGAAAAAAIVKTLRSNARFSNFMNAFMTA